MLGAYILGPRLSTIKPHLNISLVENDTHNGPQRYIPRFPPNPTRLESVDVIPSLEASCGA